MFLDSLRNLTSYSRSYCAFFAGLFSLVFLFLGMADDWYDKRSFTSLCMFRISFAFALFLSVRALRSTPLRPYAKPSTLLRLLSSVTLCCCCAPYSTAGDLRTDCLRWCGIPRSIDPRRSGLSFLDAGRVYFLLCCFLSCGTEFWCRC